MDTAAVQNFIYQSKQPGPEGGINWLLLRSHVACWLADSFTSSFPLQCLLFLYFDPLHWLETLILCCIGVEEALPVCSLTPGKIIQFFIITYDVNCGIVVDLYQIEVPLYSQFDGGCLSGKEVEFCHLPLLSTVMVLGCFFFSWFIWWLTLIDF